MGEELKYDAMLYVNGECLGTLAVGKIEISKGIEDFEPVKPFGEISGTFKLKNIKCSKAFRDMIKKQINRLKARRLNVIVKKTRKPRIKKKLVKRILELI